MALSQCPKCEGKSFESVQKKVNNLNYPITFIQCALCGTVVGALDTNIIGKHITNAVEAIMKKE